MLKERLMKLHPESQEGAADEKKEFPLIGFYDYTVIITYVSLAVSLCGMLLAIGGQIKEAVICLAMSGFLDMFDGKVARTKKDRTEDEKSFGIQIDSLCDVVCFGVLPVIICYQEGMNNKVSIPVLIFYCLCGLIRLGYFNVMEQHRQQQTSENRKYYQGLPITSISVILPLLFVVGTYFPVQWIGILHIAMFGTGMLFVTDFRFRKPNNKELCIIVSVVAILVLGILMSRHGANAGM